MRTYLTLLTLILAASFAVAQDPGMQAAQQANDQMMQASQ